VGYRANNALIAHGMARYGSTEAAMQLFAHTDPNKAAKQAAPTILTLVQDAAAGRPSPLSVTEWDFAYLKSLYAYSDMYKAGAHRGELARRMARYMTEDGRY